MDTSTQKKKKKRVSLRRYKYDLSILMISALVFVILMLSPYGSELNSLISTRLVKVAQAYSREQYNNLEPVSTDKATMYTLYNNLLVSEGSTFLSGTTGVSTIDPRIVAMKQFLIDYHSPLYLDAETFVKEADKNGLDWRLVASISGVESGFGTLIPGKVHNGWGWRGGPGGAYSEFPSWRDAITHITARLAAGYGTTLTPFDIEQAYCPPCYASPRHEWANGVTRYMNELKYYHDNLESVKR